ncbi:MAG: hypothetical protein AAB353_04710 [Candidatus Hydrogenedentota bacterium]
MFGHHANASRLAAIAATLACLVAQADPGHETVPKVSPTKPETSATAPAARESIKPAAPSRQAVSFVGRGGGPVRVIQGGNESTLETVREIHVISPPSNAPEYAREDGGSPKPRPEFRPARSARADKDSPPPPPRDAPAVKPASLIAPKRLVPGDGPPR